MAVSFLYFHSRSQKSENKELLSGSKTNIFGTTSFNLERKKGLADDGRTTSRELGRWKLDNSITFIWFKRQVSTCRSREGTCSKLRGTDTVGRRWRVKGGKKGDRRSSHFKSNTTQAGIIGHYIYKLFSML